MLKQLLKYEFKATKRRYFGLYLALALLSVVLGVTFRQEHALAHSTSFQNLEVILMIVYVSVILAIAVLCFVNTIQRFYQNLLGREGYLMHTLPVNENQLILSKLLTSMVWVLCSGLVGIVCITVMVSIGVIDSETFGMVDWNSWKQLWQMLYEEMGTEFWVAMAWTILINLARLASLILCVYAACMIAHAYAFDVIVCQSEFEALVLEASQIKAHTPKYNILLKDDKGYSYIKVTKEPWPRLSFVLQKEEDDAEYIGPYTSSFAARQMAETAMDAFLLPRCNKRFPQEIGKGRPCLNAHIGKCMAVCSGRISCENYNQAVKSAVHLIRYGKKDILKILNERMQEASDRLEFETAALLRDQIAAITKVSAGQKVIVDPDVEMDVVALAGTPDSVCAAVLRFRDGRLTDKREFLFHDTSDIAAVREEFLPRYYLDDEQIPKIIAVDELPPDSDALQQALNEKRGSEVQLYVPQRGDKAHLVEMAHTNAVERLARESGRYAREEKLLDELAQVLGLAKPPRAIESYDISNWGDGSSVCGMVTFRDGKPYKAGYRRFKMKTVAGTDDYASLAETVSRRAAEYEKYAELAKKGEPCSNWFGQKPDLLLMDGGRGQVSAAKEALAGTALADVPLYGMVKDDHHRTRAIVDSDGREIAINMNRGTFTFITAIQDETHRFANAYRKQQMKQKSYSSTLTEIPGIGPKTAKALMAQFKSVTAVKEATPDQLENTPGVGKQTAQIIYDYFHA